MSLFSYPLASALVSQNPAGAETPEAARVATAAERTAQAAEQLARALAPEAPTEALAANLEVGL